MFRCRSVVSTKPTCASDSPRLVPPPLLRAGEEEGFRASARPFPFRFIARPGSEAEEGAQEAQYQRPARRRRGAASLQLLDS
jgi:hypothetical protein